MRSECRTGADLNVLLLRTHDAAFVTCACRELALRFFAMRRSAGKFKTPLGRFLNQVQLSQWGGQRECVHVPNSHAPFSSCETVRKGGDQAPVQPLVLRQLRHAFGHVPSMFVS